MYLKSIFGHEGIFENLAEFDIPQHFMEVTQSFFKDVEQQLGPLPERAKKTVEMLLEYNFGYINYSR